MTQQTAVELFIAELKKWSVYESATSYTFKVPLNVFIRMEMEAKQMEKWQIENAFFACWKANMPDGCECKKNSVEYYNETYGTE